MTAPIQSPSYTPIRRSIGAFLAWIGTCLAWIGGWTSASMMYQVTRPSTSSSIDLPYSEREPMLFESRDAYLRRIEDRLKEKAKQASDGRWFGQMVLLASGLIGGGGIFLKQYGKRLQMISADEEQARDQRSPIILLRSFADDSRHLVESKFPGMEGLPQFTGFGSAMEHITLEEVLSEQFRKLGPVVAIGRPGDTLPPIGASRTWVDHSEWKSRVDDFISNCSFTVMIMGVIKGEDGLAWELSQVLEKVRPERLIFILPPLSQDESRAQWTAFHDRSHGRIPAYEGGELVVTFDPAGVARVFKTNEARYNLANSYREAFASLIPGLAKEDPKLAELNSSPTVYREEKDDIGGKLDVETEQTFCLSCGREITGGLASCASCGWSWNEVPNLDDAGSSLDRHDEGQSRMALPEA